MLNRLKHLFGDKKNKEFGINNITPIEKIAPKEKSYTFTLILPASISFSNLSTFIK